MPTPSEIAGALLRPVLRPGIRAGCAVADALRIVPRLEVSSLLRAAGRTAEQDPRAIEPLEAMLHTARDELDLTAQGRVVLGTRFVRVLQVRGWILDRSEAGDLPKSPTTGPPIFVTGFPRTGTTLSHRILASATEALAPTWAEVMEPSLDPDRPTKRARADRLRRYRTAVRLLHVMSPGLRSVHEIVADGPEECTHLHEGAFDSESLALAGPCPAYRTWLAERDDRRRRERYTWQDLCLRAILADREEVRRSGRWVLKAPQHLRQLDDLFAVFPDAVVVRLHRDPIAAMASTASLVQHASRITSRAFDPAVGEDLLGVFEEWQADGDDGMARHADRVLEVAYDDLVGDPVGFVERVHHFAGIPVDGGHVDAVRTHLMRRPKHHFGRHRYSIADYGLRDDEVKERLAGYIARVEAIPRFAGSGE